jgi:hypothetical protein
MVDFAGSPLLPVSPGHSALCFLPGPDPGWGAEEGAERSPKSHSLRAEGNSDFPHPLIFFFFLVLWFELTALWALPLEPRPLIPSALV